jgi:peptidylprolyl isomerase
MEAMSLSKPIIERPDGPAPEDLKIDDLVVGEGAEARAGDTVQVHYLGVEYDSGSEFDASWNRGESIEFPLRGLIKGWQDGIPGMKVGGRRQLTIPPELAYGPSGGGHRLSGKTLIFVIDLLAVKH